MLKKTAQPPYWPKVKQGLQTLGLKPEIMSMLNSNKCMWGPAPSSGDPNAAAYVSSEDVNNDGKIDKIHFVINKFPPNATDEEIKYLVAQIAKTLVHEYGHIEDFDAERGEFPGGEGVAEAAERAAEGMINQRLQLEASKNTTNKKNRIDNVIKLGSKGGYKMQSELVKLANHLDNIGHRDLADRLDSILKSAAVGVEMTPEEKVQKAIAGWNALSGEEGRPDRYDLIMRSEATGCSACAWDGSDFTTPSGLPLDLSQIPGTTEYETARANLMDSDDRKVYEKRTGPLRAGTPATRTAPAQTAADNSPDAWTLRDLGYEVNEANIQAVIKAKEKAEAEAEELGESSQLVSRVEELIGETLGPPAADNEAFDDALASESVHDRINKLAELMSSEFTTNVTGVFRR